MADALGRPAEARAWRRAARELRRRIRRTFFDRDTGWFFDRRLGGDLVRVYGSEGWVPL